MLVLSRKLTESIQIGDDIKLTIVEIRGNHVRVGIEAPRQHKILRGELRVRSELTSGLAMESQLETPARSEAETVSLVAASDGSYYAGYQN